MSYDTNIEGEDLRKLISIVKWQEDHVPPDTRDRTIRAPLAHRMVHATEELEIEDNGSRPDSSVTLRMSNFFEHLVMVSKCLKEMHSTLKQVHCDISIKNMLLHYGKDCKVIYLLNDFDSQYAGRLTSKSMYGDDAEDPFYRRYTYEKFKKHTQKLSRNSEKKT